MMPVWLLLAAAVASSSLVLRLPAAIDEGLQHTACAPVAGDRLRVAPCSADQAEAQGFVAPATGAKAGNIHMAVTYVEGLCLDGGDASHWGAPVSLADCQPARHAQQSWELTTSGASGSLVRIKNSKSGQCLNLNSHGEVDQYDCEREGDAPRAGKNGTQTWAVAAGEAPGSVVFHPGTRTNLCLAACAKPGPAPPPSPPSPAPNALVHLSDKYSAFVYEGVWAMSANGAARLLFEYPEPTRSQILDMLFLPATGTRWQGLKVEIGGDVESSYGSMSSYAHVADNSSWSWNRGVQWWLIKEAKKRNPLIPLMALSWGMPAWVGGGKTLSQGGADYHVNYLLGAKRVHNISFDWIGIWNEAPWSADYILTLRHSLDAAGLEDVQITAADGGTDVIKAAASNKTLENAIGSFGIHTHVLAPDADINRWNGAKRYFNTENDLVDGAIPQWGATMQAGLNWPAAFINNYLLANGTATMLCPAFHGWSMNLGRHNHGPAFFNDPWSGFYQLAAPFYTQAQFTQFTEIGWRFIEGGSGHTGCTGEMNKAGQPQCDLTYAALASPDGAEFSVIIVSLSNSTKQLRVELGGSFTKFAGTPLQHWTSTETAYFAEQPALTIPAGAPLTLQVPAQSVVTISNRQQKGGWANYLVPERTRFPLPFDGRVWESQPIDAPCINSNPMYGAFEIATDPTAPTADHKVCKQSTPANPGGNAWTHRHNGWPFTALPSGSNVANIDVTINAKIVPSGSSMEVVTVCGRVPIWSPSACQMSGSDDRGWAPGVCLSIMANHSGGTKLTWRLTEAHNMNQPGKCSGFTVLANGEDVAGKIDDWRQLSLSFSGASVTASIDDKIVAGGAGQPPVTTTMPAGVAGFGSAWNIAHFSRLHVAPHVNHPPEPKSFIFDVVPSEKTISNFDGWAGMILDLRGGKCEVRGDCGSPYPSTATKLLVSKLGRFKTDGNKGVHSLGIVDAATGSWLVGGGNTTSFVQGLEPTAPEVALSIDMASCNSDVLGFCYTDALVHPVELKSGSKYYIVSSETTGEAFVNMTMSVTGADYGTYRDGDSLMTYHLPTRAGAAPMAAGHSLIPGKVSRASTSDEWVESTGGPEGNYDLDCSFGPVNIVLA